MEYITFRDISLSPEESRDIIEFIAKKRNVNNYKDKSDVELLSAIKEKSRILTPKKPLKNPKHKNNRILTPKKPLKNQKRKVTENLTPKKPFKNPKSKNNQILTSRNKERIDIIKEFLKDLNYKLSKNELKEIKKNLYNIEKGKQFESEETISYLNELDQKILESDRYPQDCDDSEYIGVKNVRDLFKLSVNEDYYKPKLTKSGYDNNYTQYESKGDRILSIQEYLALIKKYLRELINQYKNEGEWKIQLIAEISFISLKPGSDETRVMYTRSDNGEFMSSSDTDEVIKLLFRSLLQKCQENLQNKMRGSDFEFDGVNLLYYNFNKISLNRGGSYIEPAKWIKDKKSIINPKNNDHKCFQYAVTLALNYDKIDRNPQRISKIRPFIDQYNWKDIDYPATSKDWKKIEQNNESITLNILYVSHNTRKIHIAYKSRHNLTREKQVILLMITDGEKWHCLVVKNLSGLLRGVTSNHNGDFYCLNCFHSYSTKNKLEAHKKICENHDYCHVEMPTKDNNTMKYNQGEKSIKLPFAIYTDLECLLEKMSTCIDNPNESSTTEINKHTPSDYSIFTSRSFDESKNKLNYYRGDDCIKKFCKDLKEHAMKIINYEKKRIVPLTTKEKICYNKQKIC